MANHLNEKLVVLCVVEPLTGPLVARVAGERDRPAVAVPPSRQERRVFAFVIFWFTGDCQLLDQATLFNRRQNITQKRRQPRSVDASHDLVRLAIGNRDDAHPGL